MMKHRQKPRSHTNPDPTRVEDGVDENEDEEEEEA